MGEALRKCERVAHAYVGDVCHCPHYGALEALRQCVVGVAADGRIALLVYASRTEWGEAAPTADAQRATPGQLPAAGVEAVLRRLDARGVLTRMPRGDRLFPGFIDTHVHAPQWPVLGKRLHLPLNEWLQNSTFPAEARFADDTYARYVCRDLVRTVRRARRRPRCFCRRRALTRPLAGTAQLLRHGTTTTLYFSSIHLGASLVLVDECLRQGQRAFVGKVSMDNPDENPEFYNEETEQGLADVETFIKETRRVAAAALSAPARDSGVRALVEPVITPRFLPSCTDDMLSGLGKLAEKHGCCVQSHASEGDWEVAYGAARFGETDAVVFDRFGLMRAPCVMAHSVFLTDDDLKM